MTESFVCEACGTLNRVAWDAGEMLRQIACIGCAYDESNVINEYDESGAVIASTVERVKRGNRFAAVKGEGV